IITSSKESSLMPHARVYRPRVGLFIIVSLAAVFASAYLAPEWQLSYAQDAQPAAAAADAPTTTRADDGLFIHILKSAGPIFGPLLGFLSVALVALIVLLFLDLKMENAIPPHFVEEFTDTVNQRKFKEAFDLARNSPSFLGKVLTGGMSRLQYGIEDARDAAMNMVDS